MVYRQLESSQIDRTLFQHFIRRQVVTKCWRKVENEWVIQDDPFVDDWDEQDYQELIFSLQNTTAQGGVVFGAFENGVLKGFAAVESKLFGKNQEYLDLSFINVSQDMRKCGIGKMLFGLAKAWAKTHGGEKLYISGHSAVESQAFYKAMGCVEALEYNLAHVEKEPFDCQLECLL